MERRNLTYLVEDIGKYLGKVVEDSHGRCLGKIVALLTNDRNEVTDLEIEDMNGELIQYPVARLSFIEGTPVIIPSWKFDATNLKREYEVATKRMHALELLWKEGELDDESYKEMKKRCEALLDEIRARKKIILTALHDRETTLIQQMHSLQTALTENKMLFSSGYIESASYKVASDSIRSALEKAAREKKDLEATFQSIQDLEKASEINLKSQAEDMYQKVPDFVVVHVKETAT
jgi:Arc/MetJ-type ribon-helix-helix transcriptional regulator